MTARVSAGELRRLGVAVPVPESLPAGISEREFTAAVVDLGRSLGWLAHHTRPARTGKGWRTPVMGDAGFVDVVAAKAGRLLLIELKKAGGRLRPGQKVWAATLMHGPAEYYQWRPSQWGEIVRTMTGG